MTNPITEIVRDCPECGATGILMTWAFKMYSHTPGEQFPPGARWFGAGCNGPRYAGFFTELRNAGLADAGNGERFKTDAEADEQHLFWDDREYHRLSLRAGRKENAAVKRARTGTKFGADGGVPL